MRRLIPLPVHICTEKKHNGVLWFYGCHCICRTISWPCAAISWILVVTVRLPRNISNDLQKNPRKECKAHQSLVSDLNYYEMTFVIRD